MEKTEKTLAGNFDSATFTAEIDGFPVLYTIREKDQEKDFMDRVKQTANMLSLSGFTPQVKKNYEQKPVVAQPIIPENLGNCEKCGAQMIRSKKGNPYCKDRCWIGKNY